MARPRSADPEATRDRVIAAAREIVADMGLTELSARRVAKRAGVSAATVCDLANGMMGLRVKVIELAFQPLFTAFEAENRGERVTLFEIVTGLFSDDPSLARLVCQIAVCPALRKAEYQEVVTTFHRYWSGAREHLSSCELPNSGLRAFTDLEGLADRFIALYFAAAFHLAREPKIEERRLRMLLGLP